MNINDIGPQSPKVLQNQAEMKNYPQTVPRTHEYQKESNEYRIESGSSRDSNVQGGRFLRKKSVNTANEDSRIHMNRNGLS